MRKSTIIGGLATLCAVGTSSGLVISNRVKIDMERLEQLAKVDEYKHLDSGLRVMSQAKDDSGYSFPHQGLVERRDMFLQDPEVQEYLSSQTQVSNLTYISFFSGCAGILMFCLAFYQRKREYQSLEPAQKPA